MRFRLAVIALVFALSGCGLYQPGNPGTGTLPSYCRIDIGPSNPHPDCP